MTEPDHLPDAPPTAGAPPAADEGDPTLGAGLVQLSFAGTGALLVAGVAGVLAPDGAGPLTAVVSGVLFAVGVVLFLWGYATGVVRSREEQVTLGGLFFLSGSAPRVVRFRLRISFAVQVAVAVAAASIRPYTAVAFAVLAPMLGLGAMAMWGARHGAFHPKGDARS
ncbi:MAG TPA: hypothetical protein VFU14_01400 [Acidimicrobiales bacterium]|nr:hypothetical protein [Acidimicrobiales bacterium]